jgi:NMD protein affecting ribosome stability and mRNA decay
MTMDARKCHRCGHWWTSNSGPAPFDLIARICPDCIPRITVVLPADGLRRIA